jgi:PAS domain S-box-containing protein
MLHKDGSIRWIMARGSAIRDAQGNPVRVVGTDADITQRKQAEDELRESEQRYRQITETSIFSIYQLDIEGNIVFMNTAGERMYGYEPEELRGKHFSSLVPKKWLPQSEEIIRKVISGQNVQGEIYVKHKKGHEFPIIYSMVPARKEGKIVGFTGISHDITEQKNAEQELSLQEEQLEEKSNNLIQLNTALNVLLEKRDKDIKETEERVLSNMKQLVEPFLEKLGNSGLSERQKTYLEIIQSNLNEIISPFARKLSAIHFGLTPKEIQVANLVREGKTTKEIAELLNSSVRAVEFHRDNLRKKFGLKEMKANLRTYLLSEL